jgi:serine/threonine kinase 32
MRYAFQDDENCFFVLDLMMGGDLRYHLDQRVKIPEAAVRLWTAELSSAIEYLHRQRIVHRDIKPDNILIDAEGHVALTDFNVAMHYSSKRMHTSVGGSIAYMAPEMVARTGYTWCVDWWGLGVTMFEVLHRRRPFDAKSADKMKDAILRDRVQYGSQLSPEALSALQGVSSCSHLIAPVMVPLWLNSASFFFFFLPSVPRA